MSFSVNFCHTDLNELSDCNTDAACLPAARDAKFGGFNEF